MCTGTRPWVAGGGVIPPALVVEEAKLGAEDPQVDYTWHELARCAQRQGRGEEAEVFCFVTVGWNSLPLSASVNNGMPKVEDGSKGCLAKVILFSYGISMQKGSVTLWQRSSTSTSYLPPMCFVCSRCSSSGLPRVLGTWQAASLLFVYVTSLYALWYPLVLFVSTASRRFLPFHLQVVSALKGRVHG